MKILFSTLTVLFFMAVCPNCTMAQTVIEYDYCGGTFKEKLKAVKTGEFVIVKITNVNTFLQKVEISGTTVNYVTPVPSELQALFRLPDTAEEEKEAEEAISQGKTAVEKLQSLSSQATERATTSAENLALHRSLRAQLNNEKARKVAIDRSLSGKKAELKKAPAKSAERTRISSDIKELSSSQTTANNRIDALENELAQVDIAQEEEDDARIQAFKDALSNLYNTTAAYMTLSRKIADIKFIRARLIDLAKQDWCKHADMIAEAPEELTATGMKQSFVSFNEHFAKIAALYTKALDAANATGEAAKNMETVKQAYALVQAAHTRLSEDNFLTLIQDVFVLQDAIHNEKSFTVVSPPVQVDGDFIKFQISSTPVKLSDLKNHSLGKSFGFEVSASRGWKADFSVGPAFSFGPNALDDKYFLARVTDSTATVGKSNNRSVVFPAVAAMFHTYPRSGTQVNIGLMMGVGAGFKPDAAVQASYYLGPTMVLGKQQKVMFSLGVSFLPVSRIKSIYEEGSTYEDLKESDLTEKVTKSSFFFSLSYNLTNRTEVK